MAILKLKTSKGVKIQIDERQLSDWRFVSALADVDSGDESRWISGTPILAKMLFGPKENEVLESLKDEDGFISTDSVLKEIKAVFGTIKEMKEAKETKN